MIANGCKHIVAMNTPDLSKIPLYKNKINEQEVYEVSKSYYESWMEMINKLIKKYPNYIKVLDIYQCFYQLLNEFATIDDSNVIDRPFVSYNLDLKELWLTHNINPSYNGSLECAKNYFFFDDVHPTEWAHNKIGEKLYQLVSDWR